MAEYARSEINSIGGYYAYSRELINGDSIYDFDVTKLSVNTLKIGLAGVEVYDLLRKNDCHIVGEKIVKVDHNLMAVRGATVTSPKEPTTV